MLDLPIGRCKHFSFLIQKNRIISIGYNQSYKSHPLAAKYGHRFNSIHSELHCLSSQEIQHGLILINTRLDLYGNMKNAKPCNHCQKMIVDWNIDSVFYTTENGWEFYQV